MKEWSTLRKMMLLKGAAGGGSASEYTATGNPLSFLTDLAKPLKELLVSWTPTQSGSGDPSPSNVRPVVGMDGVNVWHGGENQVDIDDKYKLAFNENYNKWSSENGTITITGNATGGYIMPCKPNEQYTYSFDTTYVGANMNVRVYEFEEYPTALSDGTLIVNVVSKDSKPPVSFATAENTHWLVVGFYAHHSENIIITNVMVNFGETATAYAPYSGTSYSVAFPVLGKNKAKFWQAGYISTQGTFAPNTNNALCEKLFVQSGQTVAVSTTGQNKGFAVFSDANLTNMTSRTGSNATTFTATSDCYFVCWFVLPSGVTASQTTMDESMCQIEFGSSATSYEPYTNTVYGGTLDLTTGVLTAEWARVAKKFSECEFGEAQETGLASGHIDFPINVVQCVNASDYGVKTFCNICGRILWGNATYTPAHYYINTQNRAWLAFQGDLPGDTLIELYAKLATPQTYQLTPTQITALIGNNTMWADADDLSVTYLKKG